MVLGPGIKKKRNLEGLQQTTCVVHAKLAQKKAEKGKGFRAGGINFCKSRQRGVGIDINNRRVLKTLPTLGLKMRRRRPTALGLFSPEACACKRQHVEAKR